MKLQLYSRFSENERIFSSLKRIVTNQRTSLSDKHTEELLLVSHETRRLYGSEKLKMLRDLRAVQQKFHKKRTESNKRVAVSMAALRATKI